MTSKLNLNPPPDDFEMPPDCEGDEHDDRAIAATLAGAYDAPPMPRSLTKRLEAGIAEQWGHSPQLAAPSPGSVATLTLPRSLVARSWWFAGAAAATVAFVLVLSGGSGRYAWAAVVAAMQRQGVVHIADQQDKRWLDLANGVACQQTQRETKWIDLRRSVALTYVDGAEPPRQDSLRQSDGSSPQPDALLVAFLLGEPLSAASLERFRGVRIKNQRVQEPSETPDSGVELHVELTTAADEQFELSLQLDPQSRLPFAVDRRALSYPRESTAQLRNRILSTDTTVVLADREPAETRQPQDPSDPETSADVETPPLLDRDEPDPVLADAAGETQPSSSVALPIGAPSQWQPVAVVDRSDAEVLQQVDRILAELWQREQIEPVAEAGDLQLLRRAYLDLAGRTPTVTEVRDYLTDASNERYQRLIDRLLDSPDHASQMAAVWRSFLIPEGVDLQAFGGRQAFDMWLSERFAAEEPYDQIVRKLLLAEGRLSQSGPLLFYSALKLDADQLAARTSRVFLGMRLECAQCHDHPFEPWSQQDFWSYAAFFAQISRPNGALENVSTVMRVQDVDRGEVMLPESEDVIAPKFLGQAAALSEQEDAQNLSPRRQRLAQWLTGPENPYFARATVNRVWSHMFGRGIVDPVDDFGENNRPVSPELLDTLASQFIASGFDLKTLLRTIALSRAYQLSSSSDRREESAADAEQRLKAFAQMNVKTLTAEQLYDCIAVATLLDTQDTSTSQSVVTRFDNRGREQFLQQFAAPATGRSEYLAGIPQALMLMNGSLIAQATGETSSGMIQSLDAPFFTDQQRIDVLFMATLSRPPRPDELALMAEFLPADATAEQRRRGLSDLLWALINSSEFTLNH